MRSMGLFKYNIFSTTSAITEKWRTTMPTQVSAAIGTYSARESAVRRIYEQAAKLDRVGIGLMRLGLIVVLFWIGGLKFADYEADGIVPLVANSPLMSFFYHRTKPLRGRNPHDVQFVTSGIHLVSLLRLVPQQAPFAEPWSRCLQLIPSDRGAFHDIPSATHARGHADPQFGSEHSGVVRPAGLTVCTLLQPVTRAVGTGADSR